MIYLRSKLYDFVFGTLWTLVFGALCLPIFMVVGTHERVRGFSRFWSRGLIWGLKNVVGLTHKEIGLENKKHNSPVIYACNHQSSWETLVFNTLVPDVAVVLKDSLYKYPILGWYLRNSPMIAVDREAGTAAMRQLLEGANSAMSDGRDILIFPEGTRQGVRENHPYNRGVALLYRRLGIPVVPVAINSGLFWAQDGYFKTAGEITVSYLPPIPPGLSANDFMDQLKVAIDGEKQRLVEQK